jgi:ribonuclease HI
MECELRDKTVKKIHTVTFEDHELNGACLECLLDALRRLKAGCHSVKIYSPSQYLVSQINAGNFYKWMHNGCVNYRGSPIRHSDLWRKVMDEITRTCWNNITAEYIPNSAAGDHIKG